MIDKLSPKDTAIEHLKNKYNREFTVVSFEPRNIDDLTDIVYCRDSEDRDTVVYIRTENFDDTVINDDYFGVIAAGHYKSLLKDIIDDDLSDYKLFSDFTADYFDNNLTKAEDLDDALKENQEQFFTTTQIFLGESKKENFKEEDFNALCQKLSEENFTLFLSVYFVSDEKLENMDETSSADNYLSADDSLSPFFKKTIV